MNDGDWSDLIAEINRGKCTPFLGAGACLPHLPLASEMVTELAEQVPDLEIPSEFMKSLTLAAQYVAVMKSPARLKDIIGEIVQDKMALISDAEVARHDPHALLAEMPIQVYLTTNYDELTERALESSKRQYRSEYCRWNRYLDFDDDLLSGDDGYVPSKECPLVYHLHGVAETSESIVVSEADYIDFVVNVFRDQKIPNCIQEAIARRALLFIGYSLEDVSFRIIVKGILGALEQTGRRQGITVQLPEGREDEREFWEAYIKEIGNLNWRVYWGSAEDFCAELRERWEAS